MNINTRIWENSIADLPKGDQQAKLFEHYAREFFMPDSIAPSVYLANVAALMEQSAEESGVQPTPSAARMAVSMEHPTGFPTWFLAAYPDVALWFSSQRGKDRKDIDAEVTRRSAASRTAASPLVDENGFYAHTILRTLVDLYRERTGSILECTAFADDLQEVDATNSTDEQALTAQQAVDLMAANITRYERELATSYGDRFEGMRPRLTVAGLLQLGYYVLVDHVIPLATLIQAADESVSADDPVVEFVEQLEIEVFCAEGGEVERKRIEHACHLLRSRILDVVLQTRTDFEESPSLRQATRNFMESSQFDPLRQAIGIRPAGSASS
ncbi:MAG: hypothetical protein NTV26_00660 [Caldiserica bacterium]|nr:hypothetical protein [Caldisericota bacterium]